MNSLSLVEKIACLTSEDKSQIEWLVDRFLAHSLPPKGCGCHVIDPKKQDLIIWPSGNKEHPNDLIVKVTNQKFIGMPRIDKRGMKYWKVRDFYENESGSEPVISVSSSVPDLVKSYLEKAKANYKMQDFSKAEVDAYCKWEEEQAKIKQAPIQENTPKQGEPNVN